MLNEHDLIVWGAKIAFGLHVLGIFSAIQAIQYSRTSQGAIAWAISLISFPYVSLPLYWIFGRDRFNGYTMARKSKDQAIVHLRNDLTKHPSVTERDVDLENTAVFEKLAGMPFTRGNAAHLCVDGKETFDAIFKDIDAAKEYLLVQFFIIHDDELGTQLKEKLIAAAKRGVRVYVLFDEIGSHALSKKYQNELREHSIEIVAFKTTKGAKNRFQLNFRNHRKIVVADGTVGYVGGHNVGDEYMGKDPKFGHWRDTHVRLEGPAAAALQISFLEDWYWSQGVLLDLKWNLEPKATPGKNVLVIPTGPADVLDTCCLFFLEAINIAKKRLWITSPYFVPDQQIVSALELAAMRGVDIRIILPSKADHIMVYLASFSFLTESLLKNIKIYRFQNGFIHQKVILVDDNLCGIGTANFDNRSFRLNFEITAIFADTDFCKEVEAMLEKDFNQSRLASIEDINKKSWFFKKAVQVARLMSPIL